MEWLVWSFFGLMIAVLIFTKITEAVMKEKDPVPLVHRDGGRRMAGYKGLTGDCVTRALAIATGHPYTSVYKIVDRAGRESGYKNNNAHQGVNGYVTDALMDAFGGKFHKLPHGTYLRPGVLPDGITIVLMEEHVLAVIDGVAYDNHENPFKQEIWGYWTFPDRRKTGESVR